MNNPLSAHDIARQLAAVLIPGAVYEVRALEVFDSADPSTKTYSALFRGEEVGELAREILRLSGRCRGIYATINPLKEQRFAFLPGFHRLQPARSTTRDNAIPERRELVLDFDSPRAAGHEHDPATDEERAVAWEKLLRGREKLTAAGFPVPTVEDSGNGYYLRYRLAPFAVEPGDDIIERVLKATEADHSTFNPSRIMRLPGGLNCKGQASADRPWRVARILEIGTGELVTREQLERVAIPPGQAKGKAGAGSGSAGLDLDEWAGIAPSGSGFTRLTPAMEERARGYLETIESAIAGQRGSNPTLWAARVLIHGFRFSEADAITLLERHYNPRCSPAWSLKELAHKVNDAASKPFRKAEGWALESRPRGPQGWTDITPEDARALALFDRANRKPAVTAGAATLPEMACVAVSPAQPEPATAAEQPDQIEPCPYAASQDMRDDISLSTHSCRYKSPVRFEKDGIRFVADRDCGNGTICRDCLTKRLEKLLKMSDSYLIRTSVEENPDQPNAKREVYAAFRPSGTEPATKRAVQRRHGERVSILTEDVAKVAEILAGEGPESDVSRFLLSTYKVEGEIATLGPADGSAYLWIISLPAGTEPPTGFQRITVAAAIRALHHAARTVPTVPEGVTRYKPAHKSKNWGDEEETEPTNTTCLGPSALKKGEVAEFLNGAGVRVVTVQFDTKRSGTTGIGWHLPAVQSAAVSMWVGGTASPFRPTVERLVELAQHWLPQLAEVGTQIGDGPRVQEVLRTHLWHLSLYEINEELKKADEQDKAHAEFDHEASMILSGLKERYRRSMHEASEFVRMLLKA